MYFVLRFKKGIINKSTKSAYPCKLPTISQKFYFIITSCIHACVMWTLVVILCTCFWLSIDSLREMVVYCFQLWPTPFQVNWSSLSFYSFFFLVFSWSWKCPTHLVFKVNYSKSSRNLRIKWKFFHGGTSDLPLHVPPLPLLQPLPSRFKLACSSSIFYISMHIFMLEHGIFPDLSSLFLSIHFQFSVQISFPWNHFCKVSFVTYHHHAKSKARECPPSIISALFLY